MLVLEVNTGNYAKESTLIEDVEKRIESSDTKGL